MCLCKTWWPKFLKIYRKQEKEGDYAAEIHFENKILAN